LTTRLNPPGPLTVTAAGALGNPATVSSKLPVVGGMVRGAVESEPEQLPRIVTTARRKVAALGINRVRIASPLSEVRIARREPLSAAMTP